MDTHPTLPQERWEQTPLAVQADIAALEARQTSLGDLEAHVVALEALVPALQEQLNQTSQHASRPPPSDPPQHPHPRRPRGKRRRGGQPGHPGHTRPLLPVDEVDAVVVLKPEQSSRCHAAVAGEDPTHAPEVAHLDETRWRQGDTQA
jgi:transposase